MSPARGSTSAEKACSARLPKRAVSRSQTVRPTEGGSEGNELPLKITGRRREQPKDHPGLSGKLQQLYREKDMRRWKCKVCGYVHEADEAPAKCPVCNADRIHFIEIDGNGDEMAAGPTAGTETAGETVPAPVQAQEPARPSTLKEKLIGRVLRHHLHPISAHFPNGILPASVVFLLLGVLPGLAKFNEVGFYNMAFVLLTMPMVLVTGYLEWQRRYKGAKTVLFLTKISCALIVLVSLLILVIWRVVNPAVTDPGSADRLIYLGISIVMLAAAGIAGFLGGRLAFAGRDR